MQNNDLVKAYNHWVIKKVDLLGHKHAINSLNSLQLLQKREILCSVPRKLILFIILTQGSFRPSFVIIDWYSLRDRAIKTKHSLYEKGFSINLVFELINQWFNAFNGK